MRVYHAQAAFRKQHRRWARNLDELGPLPGASAPQPDPTLGPVTLATADDGYVASVELRRPGQPPRRWVVRQDSQLRPDPE